MASSEPIYGDDLPEEQQIYLTIMQFIGRSPSVMELESMIHKLDWGMQLLEAMKGFGNTLMSPSHSLTRPNITFQDITLNGLNTKPSNKNQIPDNFDTTSNRPVDNTKNTPVNVELPSRTISGESRKLPSKTNHEKHSTKSLVWTAERPLLQYGILPEILLVEPTNPRPKQTYAFALIVDDLIPRLFRLCADCTEPPSSCNTCGQPKKGFNAKLNGYLLSEKSMTVTIWRQHILTLLQEPLSTVISFLKQSLDHVRTRFLEFYRGRLVFVSGGYSEYNGELVFSVKQIAVYTWEGLVNRILSS